MFQTLQDVPKEKRIEFPVAEDMQMGVAIGLALRGALPVCIYPRWNFLLLAMSQLVHHLDKLPIYSCGGYKPKVIIRTSVATDDPMNPGVQHLGDFTDQVRKMLYTVHVCKLHTAEGVFVQYEQALKSEVSTILVEMAEKFA